MHPLRLVATYLLFVAFSINLVVLLYPAMWLEVGSLYPTKGFMNTCTCSWFSDLPLAEKKTEFIAFMENTWIHWLYIAAVCVLNISLFTWFILSFFGKLVHYIAMTVIGVFMLIAAGLIAAHTILFGVRTNAELGLNLSGEKSFGLSLWVSVAGFAITFFTALVFIIQGPSLYKSHKAKRRR